MRTSTNPYKVLLATYFLLVVAYLLLPIFIVVPMSFSAGDFLRFPPDSWSLRWYGEYINDPGWIKATFLSIKVALIASTVATFSGTLAVVALERRPLPGKSALLHFVSSPLVIPHIFLAVGIFVLAVRLGLVNNEYVLAGAHAAITIPFVVLIVGAALKRVDEHLERAARILGAGPVRAFLAATLPSIFPAIAAGAMLSFFVSFDELIIAQFLLSGKETLPMRFWADVRLELRPTIAAVSSVLIVVTSLAIVAVEVLRQRSAASAKSGIPEEF